MKEREFNQLIDQITPRYQGRPYHNMDHINEGYGAIFKVRPLIQNLDEVIIAWAKHDIVYDPESHTNEQDSADFATNYCHQLKRNEESIKKIRKLILVTDHKTPCETIDEQIMCDSDLVGLGKSFDIFKTNWNKIRLEYDFIPLETFNQGRIAVLSNFYNKTHIFQTLYFRRLYERPARDNFKQIRAELGK